MKIQGHKYVINEDVINEVLYSLLNNHILVNHKTSLITSRSKCNKTTLLIILILTLSIVN